MPAETPTPASTAPALPRTETTPEGLSEDEARRRLGTDGPNVLPERHRRGILTLVRELLAEPVISLLLAAAILYLLFGEREDALVLLLSVAVVVALDVYQESRAERALEALNELSAPSVTVVRSGRSRTVPARELVRGDRVLLYEGGRVPADGEVRSGAGLLVDESLLTGESAAVSKTPGTAARPWQRPGGDNLPFVYAQTLVVRGQGLFEVRATGVRTEAGRIAAALGSVEQEAPLLRRQTRSLVVGIGVVAIGLTVLLALVVGLQSGDWVLGLLAGAALAIGMLPEEIPMVTTIYSVLGARRMAAHHALVRRFGTIPTLGCITVLCSDKTGTLTLNRMRVTAVVSRPDASVTRLPSGAVDEPVVRELLRCAALANEPDPVDPMELAIEEGAAAAGAVDERRPVLVEHVPRTAELSVVRNVRVAGGSDGLFVAAKGAPEALLELCDVPPEERRAWERGLIALARQGYRILGVARSAPFAGTQTHWETRARLAFVGLLGLSDPLRPGVAASVARCSEAGVRVVMITGDHPETAREVARQAGFARTEACLTGEELEHLAPNDLLARVREVDLYARVRPEQKLRLVETLKRDGEVVAMTGDGVNDAPALRAAHVGVAMGQRGTDVAREAASLVLLDDAFPTVVEAIRTGRRVFDNMRKAFYYIIGVHVALAGMALLPVLAGFPILLFPVEIVFFELVVDPVSSLVFEAEPEESGVMSRRPRDPAEPILARRPLLGSLVLGASLLAASLGVYASFLVSGHPVPEARALGFTTLMVGNLSMVLLCRSSTQPLWRTLRVPNPLTWIVLVFGGTLLALAIYFPPLAGVFQFRPPSPVDLLLVVGVGLGSVLANDLVKRRWFTVASPRPSPTPT